MRGDELRLSDGTVIPTYAGMTVRRGGLVVG